MGYQAVKFSLPKSLLSRCRLSRCRLSPRPTPSAEPVVGSSDEPPVECVLGAVEPLDVRPAKKGPDQVWPHNHLLRPAFTLDFGNAADEKVVIRAATLRGANHMELQEARQDSYAVLVTDDMFHLAVADGVGSERYSDIGSHVAVSVAVESSRSGQTREQIGQEVADALRAKADQMQVPADELSTTLCWARIRIGNAGHPWSAEVAEWGDTEILVYDTRTLRDGHPNWKRLSKSEEGLANSVHPLPRHQAITASATDVKWEPGEVFGLFTDGVAGDIRHDTVLGHALASVWHTVPTPWEFAGHIAFRYGPANDDRTAVVLWRTDKSVLSKQSDPEDPLAVR